MTLDEMERWTRWTVASCVLVAVVLCAICFAAGAALGQDAASQPAAPETGFNWVPHVLALLLAVGGFVSAFLEHRGKLAAAKASKTLVTWIEGWATPADKIEIKTAASEAGATKEVHAAVVAAGLSKSPSPAWPSPPAGGGA